MSAALPKVLAEPPPMCGAPGPAPAPVPGVGRRHRPGPGVGMRRGGTGLLLGTGGSAQTCFWGVGMDRPDPALGLDLGRGKGL